MKKIALLFFFSILLAGNALAYVPPSFFLLKKLATDREAPKANAYIVKAFKAQENGRPSEQALWERKVLTVSGDSRWPTMALMFETDPVRLQNAVRRFDINFPDEQELLRNKLEKVQTMTDMPHPFYKRDTTSKLRRRAGSAVWVIQNSDDRAIWMEKDTFRVLSLQGPCSGEIGGSNCFLDFGPAGATRTITVKKDDKAIVQFRFEPATGNAPAGDFSGEMKEYRDSFEYFFLN